jgi:hypothetical protein
MALRVKRSEASVLIDWELPIADDSMEKTLSEGDKIWPNLPKRSKNRSKKYNLTEFNGRPLSSSLARANMPESIPYNKSYSMPFVDRLVPTKAKLQDQCRYKD